MKPNRRLRHSEAAGNRMAWRGINFIPHIAPPSVALRASWHIYRRHSVFVWVKKCEETAACSETFALILKKHDWKDLPEREKKLDSAQIGQACSI
ncbi:ribonuclease inhibitor [Echinococcus multilocularis]|uniref:Ribonuclease inhibitor n=1 Tax=Echinococcus multilocularis TaxID=6211 RepID=A0A0S4MI73_ECHMU|nr:ribonuclease inhibitor [Echinococcus multilocularis]